MSPSQRGAVMASQMGSWVSGVGEEGVADVGGRGACVSGRFGFWVGVGCGGMSSVSSPPPRLISDELWGLVEPLIPPGRPAVHGRTGRLRRSDREVLEGIAFVL